MLSREHVLLLPQDVAIKAKMPVPEVNLQGLTEWTPEFKRQPIILLEHLYF